MLNDHDQVCLRHPLNIRSIEHNGENLIILSCPLGITESPLILKEICRPFLAELNGSITNFELSAKYVRLGLNRKILNDLITLLDNNYFLENERFRNYYKLERETYHKSMVRNAALAGINYAANQADLSAEIAGYLNFGKPHILQESNKKTFRALIAPHIDYHRGQITYSKTYANFQMGNPPDVYILLGTAHQYSPYTFHLTNKDFLSPLGTSVCDRDFVNALANDYNSIRAFADEFLHKQEHSLELQIPFLHYINHSSKIVPILIGSFFPYLEAGLTPIENPDYEKFASALVKNISNFYIQENKSICFIAGVDMAHIGQAFGDRHKLSSERLAAISQEDLEYLNCVMTLNKDELFKHIAKDQDARNICGYPSLYLMLDLIERLGFNNLRTELYEYRQAVDYQTDCAVTFAGLGFVTTN